MNTAMNTMTFKGYAAQINYSDEDACFIGHIAGITDVIGFHADNVADLRHSFEAAVLDYLATCEKLGRPHKNPPAANSCCACRPKYTAQRWWPRR